MAETTSTLSAEEELIESILDEALAPFVPNVPAALLAEVRAALGDKLAAHPNGRRLVRRAMPDPSVERSDKRIRAGEEPELCIDERRPARR